MSPSTGADALLLCGAIGLCALLVLAVSLARDLRPRRPSLPDDDCPPAGLGRLVPIGGQVDAEALRGLYALDLWLRAASRTRPETSGWLRPEGGRSHPLLRVVSRRDGR